MSNKRARTNSGNRRQAKRPIDKSIINVAVGNIVAAQQAVVIAPAATFPGTVTGLRWDLTAVRSGGTATTLGRFNWVIVHLPAGPAASTVNMTGAGTVYAPEQNVLAFGSGTTWSNAGETPIRFEGSTKGMRKLKVGDAVHFLVFGTATERHDLNGIVQFFYKT